MENSWIEEFYKETDADKRLELLENNSTDMDGDSAGSSTVFRQRLWTARYGKRKPKNDAFVGCLMELKYISEGGSVCSTQTKEVPRNRRYCYMNSRMRSSSSSR